MLRGQKKIISVLILKFNKIVNDFAVVAYDAGGKPTKNWTVLK